MKICDACGSVVTKDLTRLADEFDALEVCDPCLDELNAAVLAIFRRTADERDRLRRSPKSDEARILAMGKGQMIIDAFPFFNELRVLEWRLRELYDVVDRFVICESRETYGGDAKPLYLTDAIAAGKFDKWRDKIDVLVLDTLEPRCEDRATGRMREAYQRNAMLPAIAKYMTNDRDVLSFGDCDEIPNAQAIRDAVWLFEKTDARIVRLKAHSYYYNLRTLCDYGNDWAARPRIATWRGVREMVGLYALRMYPCEVALENAGIHLGYFGGTEQIRAKVATMRPYLQEYWIGTDEELAADIAAGKDLHRRKCEMPERFVRCTGREAWLPKWYLNEPELFAEFA